MEGGGERFTTMEGRGRRKVHQHGGEGEEKGSPPWREGEEECSPPLRGVLLDLQKEFLIHFNKVQRRISYMYSCTNSCSFVSGALEGIFIDGRGKLPIMLYITHTYLF